MDSTISPPAAVNLFEGYTPPAGGYDEMFSSPGMLREPWGRFAADVNQLGAGELSRRWDEANRLVAENGVTYGALAESSDRARPWELDALPLVISAPEWNAISSALVQRARLFNLILLDLYGPQRLLSRGLLPPELIYTHPGYLREFHGQRIPGDLFLHFYAADLARSSDGTWWVVCDRTEAPSGAGYALENRIVSSRMLPMIFRDCRVQRLASFFIALRELLQRLSPPHRENPRVVLLSQGPHNSNYFEDAYLSRYLGYALVEGGDLAVRDNEVNLKTLGGLLPIDVILRRVNDDDCDPLELRADSILGAAGLLQSARSGKVAMVNSLGSSLAETPAFRAFLPRLCRELLSEDLLIPSIATWWCGQAEAREHVIANLEQLIIKPTFHGFNKPVLAGWQLGRRQRDDLIAAIRARPCEYVAQERMNRSSAPVWLRGRPQPWSVAVRTFLVASQDTYLTMPGGLTRASALSDRLELSISAGERSKDLWVLSEGPVREVTLLGGANQAIQLRRSGSELPSRVADHLFWLGRNIERAEGSARLLRTLFSRLTSEGDGVHLPEIPVLLRGLAEQGQLEPGFIVEGMTPPLPPVEQVLPRVIFDEAEPMSLRSTLTVVHDVASVVRDRLSLDSWRIIHRIDQRFHPSRADGAIDLVEALGLLNRAVIDIASFSGMVAESMTRTQGWRFLDIGRRIERALNAINLARILIVDDKTPPSALEAVLEVADSLMTYRSRYLNSMQLPAVLDLLLTDDTNPRSLAFQSDTLVAHIDQLPRDRTQPLPTLEQRVGLSIANSIRMLGPAVLGDRPGQPHCARLDRLLHRLAGQLPHLSDAISHRYLIHAGLPRQLTEIRPMGCRRN